jgi:hypothetical protein
VRKFPNPSTPEAWQNTVDAAEACLAIDSCRQYGLITGGPTINVERCMWILQKGKRRGYTPAPGAAERFILEYNVREPESRRMTVLERRQAEMKKRQEEKSR